MRLIKKISGFTALGMVGLLPAITLAVGADDFDPITLAGGTPAPENIIVEVINFILKFGAALAVLMIIISGILYMVSGGNEDKTKKAKSMLFASVVGLIIIILALVIVNFVNKSARQIADCPAGQHRGEASHKNESSKYCYKNH